MVRRLVHLAAVAKAHLDLGRVHVHVNPRGVYRYIQRVHGLAVAVQHVGIGTARAVRQHLVAHKPAIDIAKLLVCARTCGIGDAGAAPDTHFLLSVQGGAAVVHPHGPLYKICAQQISQPLVQCRLRATRAGPPLLYQFALGPDGKAHVGAGQCMATHGFNAMCEFGGVGFQKLAPCGGAEKQLFHFHCGARATRHGSQLTGATFQRISIRLAIGPRMDCTVSYGVDSGQRFTPKPHGADGLQVKQVADLAGSVPPEGQRKLFAQNTAAVVFD